MTHQQAAQDEITTIARVLHPLGEWVTLDDLAAACALLLPPIARRDLQRGQIWGVTTRTNIARLHGLCC